MTVYVTGSAGFIGSHLMALLGNQAQEPLVGLDLAYHDQDPGTIYAALGEATRDDAVVMLGAQPEVAKFAENPAGDVHTNVLQLVVQMEHAKRAGLIILASSFGGLFSGADRPAGTRMPPRPVSAYFAGKVALENYLYAQERTVGTPFTIARFANVYGPRGPGQLSPWRGVVPDWMQRRRNDAPFDVWGALAATRDFVYVADVAEALWRLRTMPADRRPEVVHLGTGALTELATLADAICNTEPLAEHRAHAREQLFSHEEPHPGYVVAGSPIDFEETSEVFYHSWNPRSLEEGLTETWKHFLMEGRE